MAVVALTKQDDENGESRTSPADKETRDPDGLGRFQRGVTDQSSARLTALERRVTIAEEGLDARHNVPPSKGADELTEQALSPELESQAVEDLWSQRIDDFVDAPPDDNPSWSAAARTAFQYELSEVIRPTLGSVGSVDCRSQRCMLRLSWPDERSLRTGTDEVLHAEYSHNCDRHLKMEPETNRAVVLFDCRS